MGKEDKLLIKALQDKNLVTVKEVLAEGANVNCKDAKGIPALHYAVNTGDIAFVALFIAAKVKINAIDYLKRTALHIAASTGNVALVKLLMENDSSLDAQDIDGNTPRMLAILSGHNIVAELLKTEVDDNHYAERLSLRNDILQLVAGEDVVSHFQNNIKLYKPLLPQKVSEIIEKCIQPENLISLTAKISIKSDKLAIDSIGMSEDSPFFYALNVLIDNLEKLKFELSKLTIQDFKKIDTLIGNLVSFYKNFRNQVIELTPAERYEFCKLKPMVRIPGVGKEFYYLHAWVYERFENVISGKKIKETRNIEASSHTVLRLFGNFYKLAPDAPGIEHAVDSLANTLTGQGSTPTELMVLDMPENKQKPRLPIIVSKAVMGPSFHTVLLHDTQLLDRLDAFNFSMHVILTILAKFMDAKPDNYRLNVIKDKDENIVCTQLVGIDNDWAFGRSIVKFSANDRFKPDMHWIRLRSIIFCLPHMNNPIDPGFRRALLHNRPIAIIFIWLRKLLIQEQHYLNFRLLLSPKELADLRLPVQFQSGIITEIYQHLVQLQAILKSNATITHMDLLEKIDPLMAAYYKKVVTVNSKNPMESLRYTYDFPPLEIMLAEYPNLTHVLEPYKLSNRECEAACNQSLQTTCIELINQIKYEDLSNSAQSYIFHTIGVFFPFLTELTIKRANGLLDRHLEELGSNLAQLDSLTLFECPQISSKGICAILSFHPACEITLGNFNKMTAYVLLIIAQHCQNFSLVIDDKNFSVNKKSTELLHAALRSNQSNLLTFVLAYGIHLADKNLQTISPLQIGIKQGDISVVSQLLSYGANPNQLDHKNRSPLDLVFYYINKIPLVETSKYQAMLIELLKHGAYECKDSAKILEFICNLVINHVVDLTSELQNSLFDFAFCHNLLDAKHLPFTVDSKSRHISFRATKERELVVYNLKKDLITALLKYLPQLQSIDFTSCLGVTISDIELLAKKGIKDIFLNFSQAKNCGIIDEKKLLLLNSLHYENTFIHITKIGPYDLAGKTLTDEQLDALSTVLKDNKSLFHLELWKCGLTADKIQILMQGLQDNRTLKVLHIEHNKLGDQGIKFLADWLEKQPLLKDLHLDHNQITGAGVKLLVSALKNNQHLRLLTLHKNPIGDEGAIALATMLQENLILETLDVNETSIGPEGGKKLALALIDNKSLCNLDLGYNKELDDTVVRQLLMVLKLNKTLSVIKISGTKISANLIESINIVLKQNIEKQIERRLLTQHTLQKNTEVRSLHTSLAGLVSQFSPVISKEIASVPLLKSEVIENISCVPK